MFSALGECSVSPTFSLLMKVLELRHSVMLVNLSQILKKRMAPIILSSVHGHMDSKQPLTHQTPPKAPMSVPRLPACLPCAGSPSLTQDFSELKYHRGNSAKVSQGVTQQVAQSMAFIHWNTST